MTCPRLFEDVDEQHLATCAECRAAKAAFAAPLPPVAPPEHLKAAALAELAKSPKPAPWWVPATALAIANLAFALGALAMLSTNTLQHASEALRWLSAGAWALLATAGAFAAVMPRRNALWAIAFVIAIAATVLAASGHVPGNRGAMCAVAESMIAAVPLLAALYVSTGFAYAPRRAAGLGIIAASAGALALHLHCPDGSVPHLMAFHIAPVAAAGLLCVGIRRLLPTRSFSP